VPVMWTPFTSFTAATASRTICAAVFFDSLDDEPPQPATTTASAARVTSARVRIGYFPSALMSMAFFGAVGAVAAPQSLSVTVPDDVPPPTNSTGYGLPVVATKSEPPFELF